MEQVDRDVVVALVILKAAWSPLGGKARDRAEMLEVVSRVYARLGALGFEPGPLTEVGFCVSAPRAVFEEYLGVELARTPEGSYVFRGDEVSGEACRSLHGDRVPEELRSDVEAFALSPLPAIRPRWKHRV